MNADKFTNVILEALMERMEQSEMHKDFTTNFQEPKNENEISPILFDKMHYNQMMFFGGLFHLITFDVREAYRIFKNLPKVDSYIDPPNVTYKDIKKYYRDLFLELSKTFDKAVQEVL
jgi:hypothetical protein